jgi:hypothetical protein
MNLTSADDLAAQFGVTVEKLHDLRKRYHWPHVRLGRFNIKFTDEQVAEIVAMQSRTPAKAQSSKAAGQTSRSAARGRTS